MPRVGCHGAVILVQVIDLQGKSAAQNAGNETRRQGFWGFAECIGGLPTMLSTDPVDSGHANC